MIIQTDDELLKLKEIGRIVRECLSHMSKSIEPGMTTEELDQIGEAFMNREGAKSAPQVCYDFPGATCISLNHEVAHGIPGKAKIRAGDLINIDVSAEKNGFFADTGGSFIVPPVDPKLQHLCDTTRAALNAALGVAKDGALINLIGRAIEDTASPHGYTIIRNLGSHGVGRKLHEEPEFIPGYFDKKDKRVLTNGTVMTIEPFLSTGADWVKDTGDGWTLATDKRFRSAQYEHTLVITKGQPIILT